MEKIRVLVVGYGNVGRGVLLSLANQPDMEVVGIATRSVERVRKSVSNIPVVSISEPAEFMKLNPDVAILCGGSKNDLPQQGPELVKYLNTVDSFDNHSCIPQYHAAMDAAAKEAGSISSAVCLIFSISEASTFSSTSSSPMRLLVTSTR